MEEEPKSAAKTKNIKYTLFNDDVNDIITLILITMLPFIFMLGPTWIIKQVQKSTTSSSDELYVQQLKELPPDTQALIKEIIEVNNHTQQILQKLEKDAAETEKMVQQKKKL